MSSSLSENVVIALAEVRSIGEELDNDHPMRHCVRTMKQMAEQIMSDAARKASEISYLAKQAVKDHDKSLGEYAETMKG